MQIRFRIVTHPVLVQCWSYWPLPLAQAIQTHCLNQFGLLSLNYKLKDIDQLCCDKKRKDYRSPWSIQMHTFQCNSKRWRILAPNRTKLIRLLSLLPAWWIPRITFLSSSEVVSVMLLFCCHVYLRWWPILTASVCNMLLCSLYLHWWRICLLIYFLIVLFSCLLVVTTFLFLCFSSGHNNLFGNQAKIIMATHGLL